jgi:hypothetical protein
MSGACGRGAAVGDHREIVEPWRSAVSFSRNDEVRAREGWLVKILRDGASLRPLSTLFREGVTGAATDGQLLERFATRRGDAFEQAFAALVERHGAVVQRLCRSILQGEHEAHDGFQATFLVLARRARSLWVRDFSRDCARLATAGGRRADQSEGPPGELRVWDLTTLREESNLSGLTGFIYGVAFSPDGLSLATAGEDRVMRVWEAATGRERLGLRGHHSTIRRVRFRPDGRYLASCGEDRTVRVWDLTPPTNPFGRAPVGEVADAPGADRGPAR